MDDYGSTTPSDTIFRSTVIGQSGIRLTLALGIALTAYSYLVALWPSRYGTTPRPVVFVREWLNFPLGIGEDFGMLGIALLLLSGGYLAADTAVKSGVGRLCVGLLVTGYLPFACVLTLSWLLVVAGVRPVLGEGRVQPTPAVYLGDLTLAGPVAGEGTVLGLGWVLSVAALFCLLLLATSALLTRLPLLAVASQLAVVAVVAVTASGAGGPYAELGLLAIYVAFPLLGVLVWSVHAAGANGWAAAPIGVGCLGLLIAGERVYAELAGWLYPLTMAYAVLILLLALSKGGRPGAAAVTRWVAERAYPLFLMIGASGYTVLFAADALPFVLALPLAALATVASAELLLRLIRVTTT